MDLQQVIDAVSTLGTLGFALIGLYAFFSNKLHSDEELKQRLAQKDEQIAEKDKVIDYERAQKEAAVAMTKAALDSHDRLADAVEARNDLDRERLRTNNR